MYGSVENGPIFNVHIFPSKNRIHVITYAGEMAVTYIPAECLTVQGLSSYILDTLRKHQLEPKCIVSQGYDGASVMSGCLTRVF